MSSDQSDDEYKPEQEEADSSNASESDYDSDGNQQSSDKKQNKKNHKRKSKTGFVEQKRAKVVENEIQEEKKEDDPDRAEKLWSSFLSSKEESVPAKVPTQSENIEKNQQDSAKKMGSKIKLPFKAGGMKPGSSGKGGSLSALVQNMKKKDKLNTLEESKREWDSFKCKEGIDDELLTFNKGKDGYLEKQDFLQRTDLRQFEIEKRLRQGKRGYDN